MLPIELRQPIAVATRLLATPVNNLTEELEVFPDPKSPGSSTPADVGALSPVMSSRPVPVSPPPPSTPSTLTLMKMK